MTYTYSQLVSLIKEHNVPYDKSYTLTIHRDYDSECPRNWDNVGIIYAPHSRYLKNEYKGDSSPSDDEYWIFPLSTYSHSGVSFYLDTPQDRWDSWCDAKLLIPKSTEPDGHKARQLALAEVNELNQWNNSDVWGFTIEDQFGEVVESCWGFYSKEYLKECCHFEDFGLSETDFESAWCNRTF